MASWDVFHADRLELERGLNAATIRERLTAGDLRDDDLVRPAGTTVAWARLSDIPELVEPLEPAPVRAQPQPEPASPPPLLRPKPGAGTQGDFEIQDEAAAADQLLSTAPTIREPDWLKLRAEADDVAFPVLQDRPPNSNTAPPKEEPAEEVLPGGWLWAEEDDEDDDEDAADEELPIVPIREAPSGGLEILDDSLDLDLDVPGRSYQDVNVVSQTSRVALPVVTSRGWDDVGSAGEGDDEDDFTLSRSGPATVEELDLAPMVDVAFQLVLFFMVTATTILYRTLEIPKPSNEQAPASVAQGRSLQDLQDDYILVEIDAAGAIKIDREPVAADMNALVERLRTVRERTHRKSMLLSADYATKHRNCVLAYDAALDIGLGIAIASPTPPQGPAPSLLPAAKPAGQPPPAKAAAAPAEGPPI